jgi:chromate transporter
MPFLDPDPVQASPRRPPSPLGEVLVVMGKLGTIAFGGPAVHVAMLREETVRRRRAGWAGLVLGRACFILPAMAIVLALAWAMSASDPPPPEVGCCTGSDR